jgi:DNA-binding transcriptional MerR regulator
LSRFGLQPPAQQDCEAMDKSEDAFRTISEAAEELDLPQHVLRFWETRFPQIRPMKRGGGRRYYRPDDVELLRVIRHLLYNDGYTIKGVQRMLKERGVREVLSMRSEKPDTAGATAAPPPPMRLPPSPAAPAPTEPLDLLFDDDFDDAPIAPQRAPLAQAPVAHEAIAPPPAFQRMISPWTGEQYRKLRAIAGELAECRRILSAANN